jgi:acyl carrier protein
VREPRESFTDVSFESPQGSLEEAIAAIQAEILDVDRVGRSDSFYDLGGTSLQAMRICARVERDLGVRALPVWLFDADVLSDFAERVAAGGSAADA